MKKRIIHVLATTALSLIILSMIALMSDAKCLFISTVFEAFGANIVIHSGLLHIRRLEFKYAICGFLLDISYAVAVLIVFGAIFDWFASTPIWILVIMAVIVYGLSLFLNLFRMQQDVREINELLQRRDEKTESGKSYV